MALCFVWYFSHWLPLVMFAKAAKGLDYFMYLYYSVVASLMLTLFQENSWPYIYIYDIFNNLDTSMNVLVPFRTCPWLILSQLRGLMPLAPNVSTPRRVRTVKCNAFCWSFWIRWLPVIGNQFQHFDKETRRENVSFQQGIVLHSLTRGHFWLVNVHSGKPEQWDS